MRLIDADALANNITIVCKKNKESIDDWLRNYIEDEITDAPTIDAELVVRCKDCKYCNLAGDTWGDCHNPRFGDGWANYPPPTVDEDGYCAWGEKLGQEENETD